MFGKHILDYGGCTLLLWIEDFTGLPLPLGAQARAQQLPHQAVQLLLRQKEDVLWLEPVSKN